MITIRKAGERGRAQFDWLDTWHTFSFADYHDDRHMGFRALRVINDDTIAGGGGFGTHPHRDMEIITYVLSGALEHKDSMGNGRVIRPGEIQYMAAGTGVTHSEFNPSPTEPVHLLQIWIFPDKKGVKPGYAEKSFAKAELGRLHLVASKAGRDGSISINQDTNLLLGKLSEGDTVKQPIGTTRHAWVQLIAGELSVNGTKLQPGDAAAISEVDSLVIFAGKASDFLLFDLN